MEKRSPPIFINAERQDMFGKLRLDDDMLHAWNNTVMARNEKLHMYCDGKFDRATSNNTVQPHHA
jgi:hypothetical protein